MIASAPVEWFDEIDSTNEEAKRRAAAGSIQPVWIAARHQSAGRGRLGRKWVSATGNLYVTVMFGEPDGIKGALKVPFVSGLAIIDACEPFIPDADLLLKWPNDVREDGQKISGILVESGQTSHGRQWVASGMGINVAMTPEDTGQPATSLQGLGAHAGVTADILLEELRSAFEARLDQARTDFAGLLRDWKARAEGLGKTVRVNPQSGPLEGIFQDLSEDGGLIMKLANGDIRTIRSGDVELVKGI